MARDHDQIQLKNSRRNDAHANRRSRRARASVEAMSTATWTTDTLGERSGVLGDQRLQIFFRVCRRGDLQTLLQELQRSLMVDQEQIP
jgi:hypothetical protein